MHTIFMSLLNITNEDLRIVYQESDSLLKNLIKKSKERGKYREGSQLFLQRSGKNYSMLYKVTVFAQMLPSWVNNVVYTRSFDLNNKM